MLSAFLIFVKLNIIAAWMFIIICFREVIITGIRLYAMQKGRILAAEDMGKYKTISQITAVIFILLFLILRETSLALNWPDEVWNMWQGGINIFMLVAVLLTLISGISYLWNNRNFNNG